MLQHFRPALVMLVIFTVLTGILYPFALNGFAATFLPAQANGSLIVDNKGVIIGSSLIGQAVSSDRYFQPRPSATSGPDPKDASKTVAAPYNAVNSSGSNLGPTSRALADRVKAAVEAERAAGWQGPIPADAVTTSASGLDPNISPQYALAQVAGVAKVRGLDEGKVKALVEAKIEDRFLGIVGEPRVNVLALNLALDTLK